jgi:GT2 family glycosyltransferase
MSQKVVAAVPSYNAGESLVNVVGELWGAGIDEVYVLDDASTDASVAAVQERYPKTFVIAGEERKGPAGNRNRVLEHVASDDLLIFVDADMTELSPGIKPSVQKILGREAIGLAGGHILSEQHSAMWWNYGFEMHPIKDAWFWQILMALTNGGVSEEYKQHLLEELRQQDADFHWIRQSDVAAVERSVEWVAEGLFAVRAATFKALGGFDAEMTYHEGQDLAKRVREANLEVIFSPSFSAVHKNSSAVDEARAEKARESQFYFFRKHWNMSREIFDLLYSTK